MKILLDGDGCVFDMLRAVQQVRPDFRPDRVVDYDMEHSDCGLTGAEFIALASQPETLAVQGLYPGAAEGVGGLLKLGDVVGWSGVSPQNRDGRIRQFHDLGVTDVDVHKALHLDADVVIDDDVRQLMRFGWATRKFLIARRYNQDLVLPECVERVADIGEVVKRLRERVVYNL